MTTTRPHRAMRLALGVALALGLGACGATAPDEHDPHAPAGTTLQAPPEDTDMQTGPFGLTGEDYWTDPWRNLRDVSWERVSKQVSGLLLDAPARVDLASHDDAPLLLYRTGNGDDLRSRPLQGHAVVAAFDLLDGVLRLGRLEPEDNLVPDDPSPDPFGGFLGQEARVDLRELVDLPWRPGVHAVTVLVGDTLSETRRMVLEPGATGTRDPAVRALLESERAALPARPVLPDDERVVFDTTDPGLAAQGVELALQRDDLGATWLVGRYHLPVAPRDAEGTPPTVPLAVLAVSAGGTRRWPLQAPVELRAGGSAGVGSFRMAFPVTDETRQVVLFGGAHASAPVRVPSR